MNFLIIFCYIIFVFGTCEILIYFNGPFDLVDKWRNFAHKIHPKFGELFTCFACLSTWVGLLFSALNYWFIPIKFTPFNIIFDGTSYWWLIIFMDGMFSCGTTWLLHQLDDMMDRVSSSNKYDD